MNIVSMSMWQKIAKKSIWLMDATQTVAGLLTTVLRLEFFLVFYYMLHLSPINYNLKCFYDQHEVSLNDRDSLAEDSQIVPISAESGQIIGEVTGCSIRDNDSCIAGDELSIEVWAYFCILLEFSIITK